MYAPAGAAVLTGTRLGAVAFGLGQLVHQGRTGATLGKRLLGVSVLRRETGLPTGPGGAVLRSVAHLLDALPVGLGYLLPLVTRRRQTLADLVCGTVVVRTARARPGAVAPAVGVVLTLLLLTAGGVVDARSGTSVLAAAVGDTGVTTPAATATAPATPAPPVAPPVGPLPPEDLQGRIAPAAPGFDVVPDADSGLGPLTVEQAATLGSDTKDVAAQAGFVALGYQAGYGRGFTGASYDYAVLVYRLRDAKAVATLIEQARASGTTRPGAVPGSVVYDEPDDATPGRSCLFGMGEDLYEVDVYGSAGKADDAQLANRTRAQYDHVQLTG